MKISKALLVTHSQVVMLEKKVARVIEMMKADILLVEDSNLIKHLKEYIKELER